MSAKKYCLNEGFLERLNGLIAKEREVSKEVISKPKIQRVPGILREQKHLEKYYDPRWMSIGPIHHGNPKFQLAEEYKLELAANFIREGGYRSWQVLYDQIKEKMAGLEECFNKEMTDDYKSHGETLNLILFFDGCAILQFIHSYCERDHSELKEPKMKNDLVAFTQHDLLLLENQIPYKVLNLLMEAKSERSQKLKDSIDQFINMNVLVPPKYQPKDFKASSVNPEPVHLLDLFLSAVLQQTATNPTSGNVQPPKNKQKETQSDPEKQSQSTIDQHPKSTPLSIACFPTKTQSKPKEQQSFRSVTDLKAAGISLKPSKTSSLRDIQFSSLGFAGTLELPPLIVDDSTGSKFMNLIAYEMCPDNTTTKYEVTSYISFLDSLIDYPADVKELRSAQILHNLLGCDKELAQLFNKIATDLVPNPKVYESVIDRIERHYKKRWMTWMAQVYNDHFSSPWTTVAFLAAALAIAMSGIQTWFTVYSPPGPCDDFCQNCKRP